MSGTTRAWIGLGGNIGDPMLALPAAIRQIGALPGTLLWGASRLYRTKAWGMTAQPDFINAVAVVDTTLGARELLDHLLAIERASGRERNERWGPRALDLDLLLYGDAVIDEPGMHVPHPLLHVRAFALVPLVEASPDAWIPGRGRADAALRALARDGIEVVG